MDFWAEHWLSVGVGVFWLSMILYGHYRGLVRIAVTMSALILSLVVTRVAMPCVTAVLNENTAVHQAIGQGLLHMAGVKDENEAAEETEIQPAYQRNIIEGLKLPEQMKEVLLENNNSEIYYMLGVDRFFVILDHIWPLWYSRIWNGNFVCSCIFVFPHRSTLAEPDCAAPDHMGIESDSRGPAWSDCRSSAHMAGGTGDPGLLRYGVDTSGSTSD